jgi:hypothetical protein
MAAHVAIKMYKEDDSLGESLSWCANYLRGHNYNWLGDLTQLKNYAIGTEIAIIYTHGTYTRYKYLLKVKEDCLVLLLSDFKNKVKVYYENIYSVYTRDIYNVKISNQSKKYRNKVIYIPLYNNPVYYAFCDIDKYIYKRSSHYKQVKKHADFF